MTSENIEAPEPRVVPERVCRLLAGLAAGFYGSLAALVWYAVHSRISGELWWTKFNVAAGLFYGGSVYSMGAGKATMAGAALLVLIYGLAGAVFGVIAPPRAPVLAALAALAYSMLTALAANRWLWQVLDPFAPAYFPPPVVVAGHLLYSLVLGRFPFFYRSLAAELRPPPKATETPAAPQAPPAPEPPAEPREDNPRGQAEPIPPQPNDP